MTTNEPPVSMLRMLLSYNPETGVLSNYPSNVECRTRHTKHGPKVRFLDTSLYADRVCWALATGEWPKGHLQHLNGDRYDNRLINLEDQVLVEPAPPPVDWSTLKQRVELKQLRQIRARDQAERRRCTGRLKGAYPQKDGWWTSAISVNGNLMYLGKFPTMKEAHEAFLAAERKYRPHKAQHPS